MTNPDKTITPQDIAEAHNLDTKCLLSLTRMRKHIYQQTVPPVEVSTRRRQARAARRARRVARLRRGY